jgi:hypothetical protein
MALNLNVKYRKPIKHSIYYCSPLTYLLQHEILQYFNHNHRHHWLGCPTVPFRPIIVVAATFYKDILQFIFLLFDLRL